MAKDTNKEEFWKERLKMGDRNREHYSVYITSNEDWLRLNKDHEEIFDKEIKPTDKVLDAGCGYGRWSERFENYTGVDFSPDFIERAKQKYPDKTFIKADLKNLPFEDNEFDVAFCVSIKHMVVSNTGEKEWGKMQKELERVSKKLLIMEYTGSKDYESR